MVIDSKERIRDKMQFAIQGITDNSQIGIAIAVGIFGVLTLFVQINDKDTRSELDTNVYNLIRIALGITYWVLIAIGLGAHANHRMYSAILENYIKNEYTDYQEDVRNVTKKNRFISWALKISWLNTTPETINKYYNFSAIGFSVLAVLLFISIAIPDVLLKILTLISF
jgi:hypothetical protein